MPTLLQTLSLGILAATLPSSTVGQALPGTHPWPDRGDTKAEATRMVDGLHRFLDRETAASLERRGPRWNRDFSSPDSYDRSVASNRERLSRILGAVDPRPQPVRVHLSATTEAPALVAETDRYQVFTVRWDVYADVMAEGLLLEPKAGPVADVVVLGDADETPEQVAGLAPGLAPPAQAARLLAEVGCRVLVPALLNRSSTFSGDPKVRMTNLSHREWLWRMGFETGRTPLGYEVDEVRAAVDWFARTGPPDRPIGVAGHGEGGRIALLASALDPRIDVAWVGGAFGPREATWSEPIDRSLFGLLEEFGDAEVASLILPRQVVIEASEGPVVEGPPPPVEGRSDAASGRLDGPTAGQAGRELARLLDLLPDSFRDRIGAVFPQEPGGKVDRGEGIARFLRRLAGPSTPLPSSASSPAKARVQTDSESRMRRKVQGLAAHTQALLRTSELRRFDLWKSADLSSPEAYEASVAPLREAFWSQVIGKLPPASEPLTARTVRLREGDGYTAYAVELPVYPDVIATGILLLPDDLAEGERRPVVVCQHGLEGTPDEVTDPSIRSPYHGYGAKLAEKGYIVYAPQNPYLGHDRFRQLQRKAHPLGKSLFAIIVRQHERTLEWLNTLPGVDSRRIAFYGLSYGGKTAMRVPAILPGYCLSICSADFNEWVVKCTNTDRRYSYMFTVEYDMYEWDLAGGFNYAELAGLIAPRPFQVERGHDDGVAPDEWIGYEFAKVKERYDRLGLSDRVGITYFNGPHEIRGEGTFDFLARHLDWPRGRVSP